MGQRLRLTWLLAFGWDLFIPWGSAGGHPGLAGVAVGLGANHAAKVAVLAAVLAAGEVFVASCAVSGSRSCSPLRSCSRYWPSPILLLPRSYKTT